MQIPRSPVDELATIRACIADLRSRESALEIGFLGHSDSDRFAGFSYNAVVERNSYEVFDIANLPKHILNDPRYYSRREVTTVRLEPLDDENAIKAYTTLEPPTIALPETPSLGRQ